MLFEEAVQWPSYLQVDEIKLADNVKKAFVVMLGKLEKEHGEPLIRRALGYITASKNGVSR